MEYEWDDLKNILNYRKHHIDFEALVRFNWSNAVSVDRSRHTDGEQRFAGIGLLDGKLYTVIFTWRGETMRIISLRRSNKGEERIYEANH